MDLFSKSLAIGLPASRVDAYLRRPDSVRVYWTTLRRKYSYVGSAKIIGASHLPFNTT